LARQSEKKGHRGQEEGKKKNSEARKQENPYWAAEKLKEKTKKIGRSRDCKRMKVKKAQTVYEGGGVMKSTVEGKT